MRLLALSVLLFSLLGISHADTKTNCDATWKQLPPSYKSKTTKKAYSGRCTQPGFKVKVFQAAINVRKRLRKPPPLNIQSFQEQCLIELRIKNSMN
jgi:hypothetical protein